MPLLPTSGTETVNGDVRLTGEGSTSMVGRLEVYWNGEWGTVCGRTFGMTEAHVACRQLGLGYAANYNFNQRYNNYTHCVHNYVISFVSLFTSHYAFSATLLHFMYTF